MYPYTLYTDFSNFDQEANGKLSEIYNERAERRIVKDVGINLFRASIDPNYTHRYQMVPKMGGTAKVTEWQKFPRTGNQQGFNSTATQNHYANSFAVTDEHIRFIAQRRPEIAQMPEDMATDAYDKIDEALAEVLDNGWSSSYTDVFGQSVTATCADAAAFFSDSHYYYSGSSTFGNIIYSGGATSSWTPNPPLTEDNLSAARKMGRKASDSAGHKSPIVFDTLIVWPDLESTAEKIIKADRSKTANANEYNPFWIGGSYMLNLVVWERITWDKWFLWVSDQMSKAVDVGFAKKPELDPWKLLVENKSWLYNLDFYFRIHRQNPIFVFGSSWTSS